MCADQQRPEPKGERVDMIAEAYEVAHRDSKTPYIGALKVIAPAKVNVHLAIGARREDGYHDAVSVMHALMLHDVVYVRRALGASSEGLQVETVCLGYEGVAAPDVASEDNLATKAALRYAQATGHIDDPDCVEIRIEKHIPHQAGLGGGSADAAAVIAALASLFGEDPRGEAAVSTAKTLGADVAFFLQGGCAYLGGVGDTLERVLKPMKGTVVLVKPEGGLSTAAVYRAFDEDPSLVPDELREAAASAESAVDVPLFNSLAAPAERLMPELRRVREWLEAQPGCTQAMLCGSGASTFAVFETFDQACTAAAQAKLQGWWARTTAFAPLAATVTK